MIALAVACLLLTPLVLVGCWAVDTIAARWNRRRDLAARWYVPRQHDRDTRW